MTDPPCRARPCSTRSVGRGANSPPRVLTSRVSLGTLEDTSPLLSRSPERSPPRPCRDSGNMESPSSGRGRELAFRDPGPPYVPRPSDRSSAHHPRQRPIRRDARQRQERGQQGVPERDAGGLRVPRRAPPPARVRGGHGNRTLHARHGHPPAPPHWLHTTRSSNSGSAQQHESSPQLCSSPPPPQGHPPRPPPTGRPPRAPAQPTSAMTSAPVRAPRTNARRSWSARVIGAWRTTYP